MFRGNSLRLSLFEPNKGQLIFLIISCHGESKNNSPAASAVSGKISLTTSLQVCIKVMYVCLYPEVGTRYF